MTSRIWINGTTSRSTWAETSRGSCNSVTASPLFADVDYLTQFHFDVTTAGLHRITAKVAAYQSTDPVTAKFIVKDQAGGARLALAVDLKPGEPQQSEAIGIVFFAAGFALWLDVSFLITGMTAGAVIANFARHHERAFHEIEHFQWPFMILFFVLAGALLDLKTLLLLGWTGVAFLLLRVIARILGGVLGAKLGSVPRSEVLWYGPALLPQAGVAVGMALVAGERFPEWASTIMAFTIASTVVFEVIGPPITMVAINRVSRALSDRRHVR